MRGVASPLGALAALACLAFAPAVHAADLVAPAGSAPVELSGSATYDRVMIDTTLRLAGDTALAAKSVLIGPHATIDTCYVHGAGSACTSPVGRDLTIAASGAVAIVPRLRMAPPGGPAGDLAVTGGSITMGDVAATGTGRTGAVSLAATAGALLAGSIGASGGQVRATASGALRTGPIDVSSYVGGTIIVRGARIETGGIDADGGSVAAGNGGAGGGVRLDATSAIDVGGSITAAGGDATGVLVPGRVGGKGGSIHLAAAAVAVHGALSAPGGAGGPSMAGSQAGPGGPGGLVEVVTHALTDLVGIRADGGPAGPTPQASNFGGAGGTARLLADLNPVAGLADVGDGAGFPRTSPGGLLSVTLPPRIVTLTPKRISWTWALGAPGPDGTLTQATAAVRRRIKGERAFHDVVRVPRGTVAAVLPASPPCRSVTYVVRGSVPPYAWVAPSQAKTILPPASARQGCRDAPTLRAVRSRVRIASERIAANDQVLRLKVRVGGLARLSAVLRDVDGRVVARAHGRRVKAGVRIVSFAVPLRASESGALLTATILARAPIGSHATTASVDVDVL
jgi:hypothetical protein